MLEDFRQLNVLPFPMKDILQTSRTCTRVGTCICNATALQPRHDAVPACWAGAHTVRRPKRPGSVIAESWALGLIWLVVIGVCMFVCMGMGDTHIYAY